MDDITKQKTSMRKRYKTFHQIHMEPEEFNQQPEITRK